MRTTLCTILLAGAGWSAVPAAAEPTPRDFTQGCTASGCHDGFAKLKVVHSPVQGDACDDCHDAVGDKPAHRFKLKAEGAALCSNCHDAFSGKHAHAPAKEGQCTACHNPHASAHDALLRDTPGKVCGECHEDVLEGRRYLHGPAAAGACTSCHAAHASEHAHLLLADTRGLCLKCHDAMKDRLAAPAKVHSPVDGDCTDCHDAHGAGNTSMTKEASPALCFTCHDDVASAVNDAKVRHSAVSAGAACGACHDSHASANGKLLRTAERAMCLSCHGKAIEGGGRTIPGFEKMLADNAVHHSPIDNGECTPCHREVHGGSHFRLLAGAYPATLYVPYAEKEFGLCFECHEAQAFASAETDDATGFRNGKQNLHYLHVARQTKGRTCRACHDVHASSKPHLIAEAVPFGAWQIPVGFTPAAEGGSCAPGCHRPYRYDRATPVVNLAPAPGGADAKGSAATGS